MQSQIWRHASSGEEPEWAQAVGDGDEDDALFRGKMLAIVEAGEDASNLEKNKVKSVIKCSNRSKFLQILPQKRRRESRP